MVFRRMLCFNRDNPHENREEKHGLSTTHKPLVKNTGASLDPTARHSYTRTHPRTRLQTRPSISSTRRSELGTVFDSSNAAPPAPVRQKPSIQCCGWLGCVCEYNVIAFHSRRFVSVCVICASQRSDSSKTFLGDLISIFAPKIPLLRGKLHITRNLCIVNFHYLCFFPGKFHFYSTNLPQKNCNENRLPNFFFLDGYMHV